MGDLQLYELTHAQKRIYSLEQFFKGTSIGNIGGVFFFNEKLDFSAFEKALNKIIQENDSLKIRLTEIDGKPYQYISDFKYRRLNFIDFTANTEEEFEAWVKSQMTLALNLYESDLYEFIMIQSPKGGCGCFIRLHHIISDGWTTGLIGTQLIENYHQMKENSEVPIVNNPSYIDYIESEKEYLSSSKFQKDKEYWLNLLDQIPLTTSIKQKNRAINSSNAERIKFSLTNQESEKIKQFCTKHNVSPAVLFEAVLAIYIGRINGSTDIIIGTAVLNRSGRKERSTTGMYVSTVPMRIKLTEEENFIQLCSQVTKQHISSFKHQKYPYDILIQDIREIKGVKNNLFDITIEFQNTKIEADPGCQFKTITYFNGHIENSLTIHVTDLDNTGSLMLNYDYLLDLFDQNEIYQLHKRLMHILFNCIDEEVKRLNQVEIITPGEKNKLLYEFNNTSVDYPSDKTIYQLFEEQVERTPDSVALVLEEREMTYRELNSKANQLAILLRKKRVGPDKIVAIMLERSFEMIIGIFGIHKAGGAYLPIDAEYPQERIRYILNDCSAEILLCQKKFTKKVEFSKTVIYLDDEGIFNNLDGEVNLYSISNQQNLAYVIYTSGSTGNPKGTMILHKGLCNYIVWANKVYVRGDKIDFALYSSYSFDLTVTSIFTPLISGNRIIIYEKKNENDREPLIRRVFKEGKVHLVKLTPSHLKMISDLNNSGSNICRIIVGGEDLKSNLAKEVYENFNGNIEIYNEYGPTETVVGCMIYKYIADSDNTASVSIGKPGDNVLIYILGTGSKGCNQLQPVGVAGEICISGEGVSKGYLNKPELTAEKFVDNPFVPEIKMYRTGDLAAWRPDGNIEFLGRIDYQVKIRGFRIELGEIESQIEKYEAVKEAVVIDKEDDTNRKYLCAYVVSDTSLVISDIKSFLSMSLPHYMIPQYFMQIEKIPLTPNGKIDKDALPDIDLSQKALSEYVMPRNELETKFAEIWKDVLGISNVSIDDNFFDYGGDSIKVIQLISYMHKIGYIVDMNEFYKRPTIREISGYITKNSVSSKNVWGSVRLSPLQKQFLMNNDSNCGVFSQSVLLFNKYGYDEELITKTFDKLLERHDILRSGFKIRNGRVLQYIEPKSKKGLFSFSLITFTEEEGFTENIQKYLGETDLGFDIYKGPLIGIILFKAQKSNYLFINIHHFIIDAVSWSILLDDFNEIYSRMKKGLKIEKIQKADSYKDWIKKQYSNENYKLIKEQKNYWNNIDQRVEKLAKLYNIPEENYYRNTSNGFISLSKQQTERFKQLSVINRINQSDMLLSSICWAFYKWGNYTDISVNIEGNGRYDIHSNINLSRTIGWFTSIYPQVFEAGKETDLISFSKSIKNTLNEVPNNGINHNFLKAADKLDKQYSALINYNFLGEYRNKYGQNELRIDNNNFKLIAGADLKRTALFDINIILVNGRLIFDVVFNKNLKIQKSINSLLNNIKNNLIEIIEHYSNTEKQQVLPSVQYTDKKAEEQSILLTGCTGFLGVHLLDTIMSSSKSSLYCLVRGENQQQAENRLLKTVKSYFPDKYDSYDFTRIKVLNGDISKDKFSLSKDTYEKIGHQIDRIIHCAALVKHFGNYDILEKVNVHGTQNIVSFAMEYNKKIDYISTIGVSGAALPQIRKDLVFTEDCFDIGQNCEDNIYMKSKFNAEKIIHENGMNGLQYAIYRVGNLTGRYRDGVFQTNINESACYNVLKLLIEQGIVTKDMLKLYEDFTPIDYCSRFVYELFKLPQQENKNYHLYNNNYVTLREIINILKNLNFNIKVLNNKTFDDYINLSIGNGYHELVHYVTHYFNPTKFDNYNKVKINSDITVNTLKSIGLEWPKTDNEYFSKILGYAKGVSFI